MTQPKPLPPLETLRQAFLYDPETGIITWRIHCRRARPGSLAGGPNSDGYTRIRLGPYAMRAHRVAWALHHGTDPGPLQVDHINRNRSDNRACNLRLVDARGNRANSSQTSHKRPVAVSYPDGRGTLVCDSVTTAARILRRNPKKLTRPLQTGRPLAWPVPGRPGLYTSSGITVRYLEAA